MTGLLQLTDILPDPVEKVEIPLGEWLPDQPTRNNPGAIEALNVIPIDGTGYGPLAQHTPSTKIIYTVPVRGAAAVILNTDVVQLFWGSSAGVASSIGDTTPTQIYSNLFDSKFAWQFPRFNNLVIPIHPNFPLSKITVGTLGPMNVLGGTPPQAYCGARVGDFLVVGNLANDPADSNSVAPSRIRWGGRNNPEAPWISDPATQADFNDMPPEGGPVVAVVGRDVGTVYQARMISRMRYVGLPNVFEITHVEDKRGAIARDAVVPMGINHVYIAEDGFFVWNGVNSTPIGDGKVNRYFFNRLEYSQRSRICGAVDLENGCVLWAFPTSISGDLDEIIIWSYRDNKFSHSIQTLEYLFNSAATNVTLESLTNPLESYTFSFDDPSLVRGGRSQIAAFNQLHTYGLFLGPPMAATIDTGEYSGPDNRRLSIDNARPLVDLATSLASIQTVERDQLIGGVVEFSTPVAQEIDGTCPILADARYLRLRLNLPAGIPWQHATGIEVSRRAGGQV